MTSAEDTPEYLEGEPEEAATTGAAVGAVTGGSLGALGTWVASAIPGFESMVVSGMMATAVGSVVGGYLGSLYSVRAESQTKLDVHEALESGQVLLVLHTDAAQAKTAASLLEKSGGEDVEIHTLPEEQPTESLENS